MPSLDVAMARSLRGGVWGSIVGGMGANLESRQVTDAANDVGETFSSWDNCMEQNYCKWPVIAVIIVGGLIVLSIVWCLARCLCCGLSCCCSCFSCLKCCGNCCGCCDPPGDRKHKYLDEPYSGPANQGYKSQDPMFAPSVHPVSGGPAPSQNPAAASPPQYAEFEAGGNRNRDSNALPAMPTWKDANSRQVAIEEEEEVEMEPLKKPQASQSIANAQTGAVTGPNGPNGPTGALMRDRAQGGASPVSAGPGNRPPYGQNPNGGPGQPQPQDPYSPGGQPYDSYNDNGFGQPVSPYGPPDQGYGAPAVAGMPMGQGRRTPHGQPGYGPRSPAPPQELNNSYAQDGYGQDLYGMGGRGQQARPPPRTGPSPGPGGRGYPPRTAPSPAPSGYRGSPGPPTDMPFPPRNGPSPGPGVGGMGYPPRAAPSPAPAPSGYRRSPGPQSDMAFGRPGPGPGPSPPTGPAAGRDPYGDSPAAGGYDRSQYPREREYSADAGRSQPSSPGNESPSLQNSGGFDFHSGYSRPSFDAMPPPSRPQQQERAPPSSGSDIVYPGFKAYQPAQQTWSGV